MKIKIETGKDTRGNPKRAAGVKQRNQVPYGVDLLLSARGRREALLPGLTWSPGRPIGKLP